MEVKFFMHGTVIQHNIRIHLVHYHLVLHHHQQQSKHCCYLYKLYMILCFQSGEDPGMPTYG